MNCYLLCEYKTGKEFSAFGLPLKMEDSDVDRVVERSNAYLDKIDKEFVKDYLSRFPVVNEDVPDNSDSPDYSDVKLKQRIKEQNDKALIEKMANPKKKKVVEKEKVSAIKKKRGRPKKVEKDNTLFLKKGNSLSSLFRFYCYIFHASDFEPFCHLATGKNRASS